MDVKGDEGGAWLLVSMAIAEPGGKLWTHAWRRLRSLGGYFLEQSTCILPARPEVIRDVRKLLEETRHEDGAGQMQRVSFTDRAVEDRVLAEMNAAIDAEYAEVLGRLPAFFSELEYERERGRVIYAEVEESEADLGRFRLWMSQIAARDYFDAPRGAEARAAVDAAADELAAFEAEAMRVESSGPDGTAPDGA